MSEVAQTDPMKRLTERERECLRLVGQSFNSKAIGRRLDLSHYTVDDHVEKARRKLGASDRFEAARRLAAAEQVPPSLSGPETSGMARPIVSGPADDREDSTPPTPNSSTGPVEPPGEAASAAIVGRTRRNSLSLPARLAAIVAIAILAALAFGALLAGARALQDVALTLAG